MKALIKWGIVGLTLILVGCGTKKKITHIDKGYEISITKEKSSAESVTTKSDTQVSKKKDSSSEQSVDREIEEYIFNSDGRVISYKKTTEKSSKKTGTSEATNKATSDSYAVNKSASDKESVNEKEHYIKDTEKEKKGQNIIYWYIGAAIFVIILLLGWKLYRKVR